MNWKERDKKHVWHPFTQHFTAGDPLEITRANGAWLYGPNGERYLDANSSWWVNTHGHANAIIGKAIQNQFETVDHIVFAGATHPAAVKLAEDICRVLPDNLTKVFFSDNGSTAVEIALKMVIQYWYNQNEEKHTFIALNGAYHGDTFGAMSVGQRGYFNAPFESLFFDTEYLDFPVENSKAEVLSRAEELCKSGRIAGLIVEPLVQGAAGMRMYDASWLDELVRIARKYEVKIIFDEVMTGFGRTGKLFSTDHCTEKPDLICLSKGLTGGVLPLGLTVASQDIYDAFLDSELTKAFLHGHSFTANPIACAAASASLDIFESKECQENIDSILSWHEELAGALQAHPRVSTVRQTGTILAFEIDTGDDSSYFSDVRTRAYNFFIDRELLLRPLGNVVFINPPFCLTQEEHKLIQKAVIDFLDTLV